MNRLLTLLVLSMLMITGVAHAHAHLHRSDPAAGSTITTVPKRITLEFGEAVTITALSLQQGDAKPQSLGPLPTAAAKETQVAMPVIAVGSYVITWRALSDDNHIMSGKIAFSVAALK